MEYKLTKRANPLDRTEEKWYAAPLHEGKISKKELSKEIIEKSFPQNTQTYAENKKEK
ncbi:MAG: hypothetical protein LBI60_00535 [Bacteroidales bacterium]|jgi:hypothetical protein|nr:hypothetical protein [Bacteroidales bacterium]